MQQKSFYAHGKLMLTGEYVVLDGAISIAIPTKFGQRLEVQSIENATHQIEWRGYDFLNELWLTANLPDNNIQKEEVLRLQNILKALDEMKPSLFFEQNLSIKTFLEFPNNWGLGSSSTLISLLAQFADINPFTLLNKTFGGSGYDIACATANTPISYQLLQNNKVDVKEVSFSENWTNNAYFIFLEKKKNSREAIEHYKTLDNKASLAKKITFLSNKLPELNSVIEAIDLFTEHEAIMSNVLETPSINQSKFSDFNGVCKSLGAWGGDFIMAITEKDETYVKNYFKNKGLITIFAYNDMIWKQ